MDYSGNQYRWELRYLAASKDRQRKTIKELKLSSNIECCNWCGFYNRLSSQSFCI